MLAAQPSQWAQGRVAIDFKLITLGLLLVPVTKQEFKYKSGYRRRAKTRTSVSGEFIESWVAPWAEVSRPCKIIFMLASSCVLCKCLTSLCVASHSVPHATTTCLPLLLSFTFFARNSKFALGLWMSKKLLYWHLGDVDRISDAIINGSMATVLFDLCCWFQ